MAKETMSPSVKTMTDGQIGKICELLTAELRKAKLPSDLVQEVVKNQGKDLVSELVAVVRKRVEELVAVVRKRVEEADTSIRVDRTVRPKYPDFVKGVMHPELELTGPAEFDIKKVEQWLHAKQVEGGVEGNVIYEHHKDNNLLESCLGLADLLAIQARGIAFCRRHFAGKAVYGWKSIVRNRHDSLDVPYLVERSGEVVLAWDWLGNGLGSDFPALRFAS